MDLPDGTHYYELQGTAPEQMVVGALTWRYDGQALFSGTDAGGSQSGFHTAPAEVQGTEDLDAYFGVGSATRVDSVGRRWILDSVDPTFVEEAVNAYNAEVEAIFGRAEVTADQLADTTTQSRDDAGQSSELINTSWSRCYCNDIDDQGYVIWDHSSDSLAMAPVPVQERGRKVIWKASGSGSATMVNDRWALTAAHLVASDDGEPVDWTNTVWCSMENLDENTTGSYAAWCWGVSDVIVAPSYAGTPDPINDYALVKLTASPGVGWFAISAASDSTISAQPDHTAGYPRRTLGCGTNAVTNSDNLTTHDSFDGRHLYTATGSVQSTPVGEMRFDTSTALGMSGGPHYYCPDNDICANGHYLTAVQTNMAPNFCSGLINYTTCLGNSCAGGYSNGPKGPSIRTWVINHID